MATIAQHITSGPTRAATSGYEGEIIRRIVLILARLIGPIFVAALALVAWWATAHALGGTPLAFVVIGACYGGIGVLVAALHYAYQQQEHGPTATSRPTSGQE